MVLHQSPIQDESRVSPPTCTYSIQHINYLASHGSHESLVSERLANFKLRSSAATVSEFIIFEQENCPI